MQSTGTSCVYQSEIEEENKQEVPAPHAGRAVWTGLSVSHQTAGGKRLMFVCVCQHTCISVCLTVYCLYLQRLKLNESESLK